MKMIGNNSMGSSTRRISNKGFVGMLKEQKARLYIIRRWRKQNKQGQGGLLTLYLC
ncbi:hypothetical protein HanIR_Chr15g0747271 [Helianthus annuus]|nr:hypothetical protein HanIR_Chr15g0747271 [Helianthus annuus]